MTEEKNINKKAKVESLDEIVFTGRNHEYGAYLIRKKYNKYVIIAFFIAFAIIGGVVAKPIIEAYRLRGKEHKKLEKTVSADMSKLKNDEPPPPPPPPPPPEAVAQQVKFKAPVVVDTVKEEVKLMTMDDMKDQGNQAPPDEIKPDEVVDVVIEKEEPVFQIVEENATFQGGDLSNFNKWVSQSLQYPPSCADAGIQGRVFVQFAINSKGKMCDVKVVRGVHPELDKEAIRVVQTSPDWFPAKQGGRVVKQQFVLPIMFKLQ
jgi:protein TonB